MPAATIARVRRAAAAAIGTDRFDAGVVTAQLEAAVVDVSGYFGQVRADGEAAGATVYARPSSALERDVEVFFLRWNAQIQSFDSDEEAPSERRPIVVLIHSWQPLSGFGTVTSAPHETTWQPLLGYATAAAPYADTFSFYTVRYDCDQRPYDNALAIWQGLLTRFPARRVHVVAHGGGAVIAQAMTRKYHPDETYDSWTDGGIKQVVTLNGAFHGTPLVQMLASDGLHTPAPLVVPPALAFLACTTPGSLDMAWNGFDQAPQLAWTNTTLRNLQTLSPINLTSSHQTFASTPFATSAPANDSALAETGARMHSIFGDDYANDGTVPERSSLFRRYVSGTGVVVTRTDEAAVVPNTYDHLEIVSGRADGDNDVDGYDEALFAPVVAALAGEVAGMALIPGGDFAMGDAFAEGLSIETPVHTVPVSPFYISQTTVTNAEMRDVMQWAYDEGRIVVSSTAVEVISKADDVFRLLDLSSDDIQIFFHQGDFVAIFDQQDSACVAVTWYGAAAYTNFRSEMDGLTPCFDLSDWSCDFTQTGYRLPSEAEWEKAARGGLVGKRFPWGDTISHAQANYDSNDDSVAYDLSGGSGLHPDYVGMPAPASALAVNGFGLFQMAGNVSEWCYDRRSSSWYSQAGATEPDPIGPDSGSTRVSRGGNALDSAATCRVAERSASFSPLTAFGVLGFRVARSR
jgi:formylglycine-generating enzyme required for sulfatase activity